MALFPVQLFVFVKDDSVKLNLHNHENNCQSHSIDLHAVQVDALEEFGSIKPGKNKEFVFNFSVQGAFIYH